MTTDQDRWDERIPELERHLNSAVNKTSTRTPFEALHGYRPRYVGGVVNTLSRSSGEWTNPNDVQDCTKCYCHGPGKHEGPLRPEPLSGNKVRSGGGRCYVTATTSRSTH
ncbi:unnamed protein product [Macrosiphum euphorbiae]|uniref:Uncharacterized protein n=1 Tax=Macrosiphum euphorbiae TaxID=13131 RepID=A0AAV0VGC9_9HEMI|nr:unnamed protein product [Macrosiphum euphorbiae]